MRLSAVLFTVCFASLLLCGVAAREDDSPSAIRRAQQNRRGRIRHEMDPGRILLEEERADGNGHEWEQDEDRQRADNPENSTDTVEQTPCQGLMVLSLLDGYVYGIDMRSGDVKWTLNSGGPLVHSESVRSAQQRMKGSADAFEIDSHQFIPSLDGSIFSFGTGTMGQLSVFPFNAMQIVESSPAFAPDGTVLLGTKKYKYFSLDPLTGDVVHTNLVNDNIVTNSHRAGVRDPPTGGAGRGDGILLDVVRSDYEVITSSHHQRRPTAHSDGSFPSGNGALTHFNISVAKFRLYVRGANANANVHVDSNDQRECTVPLLFSDYGDWIMGIDPVSGSTLWERRLECTPVDAFSLTYGAVPKLKKVPIELTEDDEHSFYRIGNYDGQLYAQFISSDAEALTMQQQQLPVLGWTDAQRAARNLRLGAGAGHAGYAEQSFGLRLLEAKAAEQAAHSSAVALRESDCGVGGRCGPLSLVPTDPTDEECTVDSHDFPQCLVGSYTLPRPTASSDEEDEDADSDKNSRRGDGLRQYGEKHLGLPASADDSEDTHAAGRKGRAPRRRRGNSFRMVEVIGVTGEIQYVPVRNDELFDDDDSYEEALARWQKQLDDDEKREREDDVEEESLLSPSTKMQLLGQSPVAMSDELLNSPRQRGDPLVVEIPAFVADHLMEWGLALVCALFTFAVWIVRKLSKAVRFMTSGSLANQLNVAPVVDAPISPLTLPTQSIDNTSPLLLPNNQPLVTPPTSNAASPLFLGGGAAPNAPPVMSLPQQPPLLPAVSRISRYLSDFEEMQMLGKGGFGTVYLARNKFDQTLYAIKKVKLWRRQGDDTYELVMREVMSLAKLDHKNTVRYYQSWEEDVAPEMLNASEDDSESETTSDSEAESKRTGGGAGNSEQPSDGSSMGGLLLGAHNPFFPNLPVGTGALDLQFSVDSARERSAQRWADEQSSASDMSESRSGQLLQIQPDMSRSRSQSRSHRSQLLSPSSRWSKASSTTMSESSVGSLDYSDSDEESRLGASRSRAPGVADIAEEDEYAEKDKDSSSAAEVSEDVSRKQRSSGSTSDTSGTNTVVEARAVIIYIQMQYCRLGTLEDWLKQPDREVVLADVCSMFFQIISGVAHIHERGFIHRDLKPTNIFITADNAVKIGDFGLSKQLGEAVARASLTPLKRGRRSKHNTTGVGSPLYCSPEQMQGREYTDKTDIFSLGVIMVEMFHVFSTTMERLTMLRRARDGHIQTMDDVPEARDFCLWMLNDDPAKRPSASQLLRSSFLTKYRPVPKGHDEDNEVVDTPVSAGSKHNAKKATVVAAPEPIQKGNANERVEHLTAPQESDMKMAMWEHSAASTSGADADGDVSLTSADMSASAATRSAADMSAASSSAPARVGPASLEDPTIEEEEDSADGVQANDSADSTAGRVYYDVRADTVFFAPAGDETHSAGAEKEELTE